MKQISTSCPYSVYILEKNKENKSCYKDRIGRDGFSGHLLESVLCIMEISDAFNCDFMEFPDDDEKQMTVKDLVQFVVQSNSRTIKNHEQ